MQFINLALEEGNGDDDVKDGEMKMQAVITTVTLMMNKDDDDDDDVCTDHLIFFLSDITADLIATSSDGDTWNSNYRQKPSALLFLKEALHLLRTITLIRNQSDKNTPRAPGSHRHHQCHMTACKSWLLLHKSPKTCHLLRAGSPLQRWMNLDPQ